MAIFDATKAKMQLMVDNPVCVSGQKFKGKIILDVKSELNVKGIYLELFQRISKTSISSKGVSQSSQDRKIVDLVLAPETTYVLGHYEFPFELMAPQATQLGGTAGQVLNFVSNVMQGSKSYYIQARVGIPWGFDKREKVNVQINSTNL